MHMIKTFCTASMSISQNFKTAQYVSYLELVASILMDNQKTFSHKLSVPIEILINYCKISSSQLTGSIKLLVILCSSSFCLYRESFLASFILICIFFFKIHHQSAVDRNLKSTKGIIWALESDELLQQQLKSRTSIKISTKESVSTVRAAPAMDASPDTFILLHALTVNLFMVM